jgi:hypothetical protein
MPTTGKNNDRKERRNSALKYQKKNYKKYKKKLEVKTFTLLKKKHYHSIKDTKKPRKFENFK